MSYDAVVLDSDGVLVEPPQASTLIDVARTALDRTGVTADPRAVARSFQSGSIEDVASRCREAGVDVATFCQTATTTAFAAQREALEEGCRSIYDDVRTLRSIDVPLGVVSDNQPHFVQYLLRHAGLADVIRTVRCRPFAPETLDRRKPNPENLAAALSDLDAETAAYVGDTAADVEAAASLGIDSVLLERDGSVDVETEPDYRIDSLRGLRTLTG